MDPFWSARFQREFSVSDHPCELAMRDAPAGTAVADWMVVPLSTLRGSRLVQEWASPCTV